MGKRLAGRGLLVPVAPVLAAAVVIGAGPGTAGLAASGVSSAGARPENAGSGNDLNGAAAVSLWHKVSSPSPGTKYSYLFGVAATSAANAWAVGYYDSSTGQNRTLLEHWDGKTWKQVPSPSPGSPNNGLSGVAATSGANAWAVGSYSTSTSVERTLIAHWNGKTWKQVPSPNPGGVVRSRLAGVAATAATNAWAVGYYDSGTGTGRTLIAHWNGKTWKQVPSPSPGTAFNGLAGVTAISATSAWAVGAYSNGGPYQTLITHWNGKTWTKVPSPSPGSPSTLYAVAASSATNAWAVGSYDTGTGVGRTLIAHWNGKAWKQVPSPNPGTARNDLSGVAAISAGNAWVAGSYSTGTGVGRTLIAHWNGRTWKKVASPNPGSSGSGLSGGVAATSASNAWAVGAYLNGTTGNKTLTLQCC